MRSASLLEIMMVYLTTSKAMIDLSPYVQEDSLLIFHTNSKKLNTTKLLNNDEVLAAIQLIIHF